MENKSQSKDILDYLQKEGSITSMQAITLFGATRLSAIIYNLRKGGYPIKTVMQSGTNRYGHRCPYAKYILQEEENVDNG